MDERATWQEEFQRISLNDLSREPSQHDLNFQLRLNQPNEKDNTYTEFKRPVTLQYRDSISSNASSTLSRNSTVSSSDTRYFSSLGSPESPNATLLLSNTNQPTTLSIPTNQVELPNTISPIRQSFQYANFTEQLVEPTGCFVPSKPLPFIQKTEVTKHHYVIPTFAMAGESQAEVMKLIFNQTDSRPFQAKEEFERTIPWHIDGNSSLVTLSQYTNLGKENPVSRNYLLGLGQRLGITTILVIVSIEAIGTVYPLIDNLIKSIEIDTNENNLSQKDQSPTWWNRVVLVINQQHGVGQHATYSQRKAILAEEMPRIQERYRLSQPLSVLFLSTQLYNSIKNTPQGAYYKSCSQRILWQMMEKHTLSGRWCSELITLQNRSRANDNSLANVLNEDDETTSSSDDALFKTVIDYVDGKKKKPTKKKKKPVSDSSTDVFRLSPFTNTTTTSSSLQRRSTRRTVQKLHCHDGDDGMDIPLPTRRF